MLPVQIAVVLNIQGKYNFLHFLYFNFIQVETLSLAKVSEIQLAVWERKLFGAVEENRLGE